MANLKIVATLIFLAYLKGVALLEILIIARQDWTKIAKLWLFQNFGFAVLVLKLPTFCDFGAFQNLTFSSLLAAVATFARAQLAYPIL